MNAGDGLGTRVGAKGATVEIWMKVTVQVEIDKDVRDEAARRLAESGLTIDQTMRIVLEQAAAGCGPDFAALVPNRTTVEAIEAARRGEVVDLGTPLQALAELNDRE